MSAQEEISLGLLDKARYRPTREAEDILDPLRGQIGGGEKFGPARLALARSLCEPGEIPEVPAGTEFGSPMQGMQLFGEDSALWATLIVEAGGHPVQSVAQFRAAVEAHWHRGALLLRNDMDLVGKHQADFAVRLASLAGISESGQGDSRQTVAGSARLTVRMGEVGIEQSSNRPLDIVLNAPGVSPHIAVMGKTRSGKTRTGLRIAEQIVSPSRLPMLIIDPRGEFVREGRFVKIPHWGGQTLADRFPGLEPLDVPLTPVPLDFLAVASGAAAPRDVILAQGAMAFRDSFEKCIRAKGDVALDNLRQTVEGLLRQRDSNGEAISLEKIRDAVRSANGRAGGGKNTIEAKLNELTSLRLFSPVMAPREFFGRRWVIGLNGAPDEAKRLVMFLVLDALAAQLLSQEDSPTDSAGNRVVRHLLIVDEAKDILVYKHGALSGLIRKSSAKGGIVMLLSQSPEDFDQEADDFLAQMGSIAVFTTAAKSLRNLRNVLGRKVAPEEFSDSELPRGLAWMKLPGKDPTKVIAWK